MPAPFTAELIVESCLSGRRVDTFLARHFRNYSTYRMGRLARAGQVLVDDLPAEWNQRVFRGQRVRVHLVEPPDIGVEPEPLPVDVLYEDSWLLIVNKPPGQTSHPSGRFQSGTLLNAVQHYLDRQTPAKGLLRPGIVHRLDRLTSGLMIVTKNHLSHRRLTIQFENREIFKSYLALSHGVMPDDYVFVDQPIGVLREDGLQLMSTRSDAHQPRHAATELLVLQRFAEHTLISARPLTGRLHQIRVHLSAVGFPIVGDDFYGIESSHPDTCSQTHGLIVRQALHAHQIGFRHPITEEYLVFEAPPPRDMKAALDQL